MTLRPISRRSGAVAPLVAVLMVVLCVVISIVLEEGMMLSESRRAQAAADAAAMAGACVLYQNYKTTAGVDSASITAATQMAANNGYMNDASGASPNPNTTSVVANNPPSTGYFKGQAGYVEVNTTYYQGRYFSWVLSLWPINATLSDTMPVTARAVAQGMWTPFHAGVLLLDKSGSSLQDKGNAQIVVNGGDVIINSNSSSALFDAGNATLVVQNGSIDITGNDVNAQSSAGTIGSGSSIQTPNGSSDVYINQHPTPDPLAYLPAPGGGNGAPAIPPAAPNPVNTTLPDGTQAVLLYPGSYGGPGQPSFPSASSNNSPTYVLMQANNSAQGSTSGIYYIQNGGFSFRNTSVVMDNNLNIPGQWNGSQNYQGSTGGLMIYNASGSIDLEGNNSSFVYLQPLTSGPYGGMVFWQDRANSNTVKVAGNGSFTIGGTFYAAAALLDVTGNGGTYTGSLGTQIAGSQVGSQFVSADMKVSGNGNLIVNYQGPPKQPIRILTLVE
jgi:Flp pilus assembly protein TadG